MPVSLNELYDEAVGGQPPPPDPDYRERYLNSYHRMRTVIGAVGIALPIALVLIEWIAFSKRVLPRGSLSAYYYTGMRDWLVGSLCVIGIFLITYRVEAHRLENGLATAAGFGALGVALFPTGIPDTVVRNPTPLQDLLHEGTVTFVHHLSTVVFIAALAATCFLFAKRDANKATRETDQTKKDMWMRHSLIHKVCFAGIAASVAVIFVFWNWRYHMLLGEAGADLAFSASWLVKGREPLS